MKLYYYCSSCQKENSFTTKATNRFELQKERGNTINERCKHCGTVTKRRINRVHAKADNLLIIASAVLAIILGLFLLTFFGLISGLVLGIPFLAWQALQKKASNFNKIRVNDNE